MTDGPEQNINIDSLAPADAQGPPRKSLLSLFDPLNSPFGTPHHRGFVPQGKENTTMHTPTTNAGGNADDEITMSEFFNRISQKALEVHPSTSDGRLVDVSIDVDRDDVDDVPGRGEGAVSTEDDGTTTGGETDAATETETETEAETDAGERSTDQETSDSEGNIVAYLDQAQPAMQAAHSSDTSEHNELLSALPTDEEVKPDISLAGSPAVTQPEENTPPTTLAPAEQEPAASASPPLATPVNERPPSVGPDAGIISKDTSPAILASEEHTPSPLTPDVDPLAVSEIPVSATSSADHVVGTQLDDANEETKQEQGTTISEVVAKPPQEAPADVEATSLPAAISLSENVDPVDLEASPSPGETPFIENVTPVDPSGPTPSTALIDVPAHPDTSEAAPAAIEPQLEPQPKADDPGTSPSSEAPDHIDTAEAVPIAIEPRPEPQLQTDVPAVSPPSILSPSTLPLPTFPPPFSVTRSFSSESESVGNDSMGMNSSIRLIPSSSAAMLLNASMALPSTDSRLSLDADSFVLPRHEEEEEEEENAKAKAKAKERGVGHTPRQSLDINSMMGEEPSFDLLNDKVSFLGEEEEATPAKGRVRPAGTGAAQQKERETGGSTDGTPTAPEKARKAKASDVNHTSLGHKRTTSSPVASGAQRKRDASPSNTTSSASLNSRTVPVLPTHPRSTSKPLEATKKPASSALNLTRSPSKRASVSLSTSSVPRQPHAKETVVTKSRTSTIVKTAPRAPRASVAPAPAPSVSATDRTKRTSVVASSAVPPKVRPVVTRAPRPSSISSAKEAQPATSRLRTSTSRPSRLGSERESKEVAPRPLAATRTSLRPSIVTSAPSKTGTGALTRPRPSVIPESPTKPTSPTKIIRSSSLRQSVAPESPSAMRVMLRSTSRPSVIPESTAKMVRSSSRPSVAAAAPASPTKAPTRRPISGAVGERKMSTSASSGLRASSSGESVGSARAQGLGVDKNCEGESKPATAQARTRPASMLNPIDEKAKRSVNGTTGTGTGTGKTGVGRTLSGGVTSRRPSSMFVSGSGSGAAGATAVRSARPSMGPASGSLLGKDKATVPARSKVVSATPALRSSTTATSRTSAVDNKTKTSGTGGVARTASTSASRLTRKT